jgi:hypothetical protein
LIPIIFKELEISMNSSIDISLSAAAPAFVPTNTTGVQHITTKIPINKSESTIANIYASTSPITINKVDITAQTISNSIVNDISIISGAIMGEGAGDGVVIKKKKTKEDRYIYRLIHSLLYI